MVPQRACYGRRLNRGFMAYNDTVRLSLPDTAKRGASWLSRDLYAGSRPRTRASLDRDFDVLP